MIRDWQELKIEGKVVCKVDRSYEELIRVELPCGYYVDFWVDITDEEAYKRTLKIKELGI